jgi:hypothetical protein
LLAEDEERINSEYETAKRDWLHFIEYDAEKEFRMGDVEEETLNKFLASIEK